MHVDKNNLGPSFILGLGRSLVVGLVGLGGWMGGWVGWLVG